MYDSDIGVGNITSKARTSERRIMNKDRYVLKERDPKLYRFSDGYYEGTSYIYQGSRYANANPCILKAKIYSSEARAKRACKIEFVNYNFVVERISDE